MKKLLIINSDDFGLSDGINHAVLEGFKDGYITSTTIMVNQAASVNALNIWKKNKELMKVGLHFCLDMGKPLSQNFKNYLDNNGNFKRPHKKSLFLVPEEIIEEELRLQIKKAESFGCKITHIDSHHHVHIIHPNVYNVVTKVCKELNLPMRKDQNLIISFYDKGVTKTNLINELKNLKENTFMDLMCHISNEDEKLKKKTSYYSPRILEKNLLKENINFKILNELSIILGSYKDIGGFNDSKIN